MQEDAVDLEQEEQARVETLEPEEPSLSLQLQLGRALSRIRSLRRCLVLESAAI